MHIIMYTAQGRAGDGSKSLRGVMTVQPVAHCCSTVWAGSSRPRRDCRRRTTASWPARTLSPATWTRPADTRNWCRPRPARSRTGPRLRPCTTAAASRSAAAASASCTRISAFSSRPLCTCASAWAGTGSPGASPCAVWTVATVPRSTAVCPRWSWPSILHLRTIDNSRFSGCRVCARVFALSLILLCNACRITLSQCKCLVQRDNNFFLNLFRPYYYASYEKTEESV